MAEGQIQRRRSPRVEVITRMYGHVVALNLVTPILNVGAGGFAMRTPVEFPVGAEHEFRFTTVNEDAILLKARVLHVLTMREETGVYYVTGLEFVEAEAHPHAIARLLEAAGSTPSLSLDDPM